MYRLLRHIKTGINGGETLFLADVNGDGKKEFIIRQSGGFYDSKFYRDDLLRFTEYYHSAELTEDNAQLLQLTCMSQEGDVLWQYGKPWTDERPYISHASKDMTTAADINNDGITEILYIRKDKLFVINGETGKYINSIQLPTEAFNLVTCQKMGDHYHIIVKCNGESEYGYGKPLLAYDHNLDLLWQQEDMKGAGHNIVCMDVDGDGFDEIFEGYSLIDHDGTILWSHDFPSHADQIVVCDINGDGVVEVIYCTDFMDFFILDVHGKILFSSKEFIHPQQVSIGKFEESDTYHIFLNNKACDGGSFMLDCNGKVVWDFPCNGYSYTIKSQIKDYLLFCPQPGRLEEKDRTALIDRSRQLGYTHMPLSKGDNDQPFVIDGSGKICYQFDCLESCVDIDKWNLPRFIQNYYGAGFDAFIEDIDHDGEDEIILYNRKNIWIYHKEIK